MSQDVTSTQPQRFARSKLSSKKDIELNNPCIPEQELSYKCLSENQYDRDICSTVFANYKNCLEFWSKVKRDRRSKGILPVLPLPEHRQGIKEKYLRDGTF